MNITSKGIINFKRKSHETTGTDQQRQVFPIDQLKLETQTTITIENIPIYFPYKPYECQLLYMKSIIKSLNLREHSLIQCPTGTGKTLSLLCSTLAWLRYAQAHCLDDIQLKIIYASRTHSQLNQVVRELKKSVYCPSMVIASSRDMSCCNSELDNLEGMNKEIECRKRVSRVQGKSCMYYKDDPVLAKLQSQIKNKVMDIEDLKSYGKSRYICPFFYSKRAKESAELILMPYNYLFNRDVAYHYGIDCKNAIIIIDEGHNIPAVAEEGYSSSIALNTLYAAIEEVSTLKQLILKESSEESSHGKNRPPRRFQTTVEMVETYLDPLVTLHSYLKNNFYLLFQGKTDNIDQGCTISIKELFSHLTKATEKCRKLPLKLECNKVWNEFSMLTDSIYGDLFFESEWAIERWKSFMEAVRKVITAPEDVQNRFAVALEMDGNNLKIEILCLDPSKMFNELVHHEPYNFIITSGTLSPINLWSLELGINFPHPLSLPSPIKQDQVMVSLVQKGINYAFFDLGYSNRNNDFMFKDLASSVFEIVKAIPNGVVIMFSSYALLESFRRGCGSAVISNYWKEKDLFFESKDSGAFKQDFAKYITKSKTPKGAIFFAVMRGKLSEGMDLEADTCRAIILIGVPYLAIKSKKTQAKKALLDSQLGKDGTITGNQWYMAETLRSINQAIGRVIRNQDDFGAIYFIDSRFYKKQITDNISEWARNRIDKSKNILQVVAQTKEFFAGKAEQGLRIASKRKLEQEALKKQSKPQKQEGELTRQMNKMFTIPVQQLKGITLTRPKNVSISQKVTHTCDYELSKIKMEETKEFLANIKKKLAEERNRSISDPLDGKEKRAEEEVVITEPLHRKIQLQVEKSVERSLFKGQQTKQPVSLYTRKKQPAELLPRKTQPEPLASFPKSPIKEQKPVCGICLTSEQLIGNKACVHRFCQGCWRTWLQTNLCCPNCRIRVRENYLIFKLGDELD